MCFRCTRSRRLLTTKDDAAHTGFFSSLLAGTHEKAGTIGSGVALAKDAVADKAADVHNSLENAKSAVSDALAHKATAIHSGIEDAADKVANATDAAKEV